MSVFDPVRTSLAFALAAPIAHAQSLLTTRGRIWCAPDVHVPGEPPSVHWDDFATIPALDDEGNGVFQDTTVDTLSGARSSNIVRVARDGTRSVISRRGDPAPSIPGATLRLVCAGGFDTTPSIRADGVVYWSDECFGGVAVPEALFTPSSSGLALLRASDLPHVGSVGGAIDGFPRCPESTALDVTWNEAGVLLLTGLVYGSTIPSENGYGIYCGTPSSLAEVVQSGHAMADGRFFRGYDFRPQLNRNGDVLVFAITSGTSSVTPPLGDGVYVWSALNGAQRLVHEGDPVPGLPPGNVFLGSQYAGAPLQYWEPWPSDACFDDYGRTALALYMHGPNVVPNVDDQAIFVGGIGSLAITQVRRGAPAPGTSQFFDWIYGDSVRCNNAGEIAFAAELRGPGVDDSGSVGIWAGRPDALRLVARTGEPCGLVPNTRYQLWSSVRAMNDVGEVAFHCVLTSATHPPYSTSAVIVDSPITGPSLVARTFDPIEVAPGDVRFVNPAESFEMLSNANGQARSLGFNDAGAIAFRFAFGYQRQAVASVGVHEGTRLFCFGDGLDTAHTSACPCGNTGSPYRGCANSLVPEGAALRVRGFPSTDDLELHAAGMPATVTCVYLQGDALADAVFGDGVRCIGGRLVRLRAVSNSGGASSFPDGSETVTLSSRGGVAVGSGVVRYYQAYYRNIPAAFCPPGSFNATNAVSVDW